MSDSAESEPKKTVGLWRFLCNELHVFPGRYNAMLRYLISSLIVVIISMALNVPQLPYSLLVIFFATQQNIVLTRIIFPLFMLVNVVAVGCAILILKFTIDYPILRLLSTAIVLMVLLYLMRSSKNLGALFFCVAITVTYTQSFVDLSSDGEMLLRNLLWAFVAGGYATVVAHIVNTLVLPVEPSKQLKQEVERILTMVSQMLTSAAAGKTVVTPNLVDVQNSVLALHKFLKFSVMRDTHYRENEDKFLAQIAAVERLYSATCDLQTLIATPLSPEIANSCYRLSEECLIFLQSIQKGEKYNLKLQKQELSSVMALPDCLREMYGALVSISLLEAHKEHKTVAAGASDLEQNTIKRSVRYDYVKFGIKTLLSVAICYVFFTSVQWPGIHTSMLTCIIVALPGLGASIQKSLLRIGGCLVGSALALFATVFILPRIDSITGLLLMISPVIALGGWVAAGSERSSYAGIQIMYAFSLAMFTDFAPSPELSEIRDRLIGILLGITVATLVHGSIWPETEGRTLRKSLGGLFVYFAGKISPLTLDDNAQAVGWTKLDSAQKLLAQVALEPNWRSNDNEQLTLNCQILLGKLRELHVALYGLETEYALAFTQHPQSELFVLIDRAMDVLAKDMRAYGEGLQNEPVTSLSVGSKLESSLQALWSETREVSGKPLESWESALLVHTEEVITVCCSMPGWNTDGEMLVI
ncbi:FUSC family protein [Serratia marcescens]|uniref:FUSC family protein n=1 Tax=Serratia marcescens TaxID=615 RepID=UPI00313E36C3